MPRNAPYAFTLRSDEKKMVVTTAGLTSVAGGGAPSGHDVIPFSVLNPYSRNLELPTQTTPSSQYSVSPLSAQHTTYVDTNGITQAARDWGNDKLFLQVPAGKYKKVISINGSLTPTTVPPGSLYQPNYVDQIMYLAGPHPAYEFLGQTVSPYFLWPPSVAVLPEVVSCTPTQIVMSLNMDKDNAGNASTTGYATTMLTQGCLPAYSGGSTTNHYWCRFNQSEVAGVTIPPSTQPGTFDDPLDTVPSAQFRITANVGSEPTDTFDIEFIEGGPADFPVGQRLRCCRPIAGMGETGDRVFVEDVFGSGVIRMEVPQIFATPYTSTLLDVNIPITVPNILPDAPASWLAGELGQWYQFYHDTPSNIIFSGFITLEKA